MECKVKQLHDVSMSKKKYCSGFDVTNTFEKVTFAIDIALCFFLISLAVNNLLRVYKLASTSKCFNPK